MSAVDSKVRKSKRQPVPNPIYQQGINQLKIVPSCSCRKTHRESRKRLAPRTTILVMKRNATLRLDMISRLIVTGKPETNTLPAGFLMAP